MVRVSHTTELIIDLVLNKVLNVVRILLEYQQVVSGCVTHGSQKTLGFLYGTIATKESNKHHDSTNSNQDVDTCKR